MGRIKRGKKATHALTSVINKKICPKSKRSQVTVFVIIAIVIVVAAVILYFLYPKIKAVFIEQTPTGFIEQCIEKEVINKIEQISMQGGSLNPENYIMYDNYPVEYLCYTNEYYKTCIMQQPMLKTHIEQEIEKAITPKIEDCVNQFKRNFEKKGYGVSISRKGHVVELFPGKILITLNYPTTITKEATESFDDFKIQVNNNLYDLVMIATSILNWEARYGDAETTTYMTYYPNIKVEKKKQTDGSTIYILTNRDRETKFQFATRSIAWPPGYGVEDVLK